MQIIIDTAVDAPQQVLKVAEFLRRMFETVPAVIHPDDNPEKGKPPEPTISELTTALQARGLPPPPSLALTPPPPPAVDPATVFGQPAAPAAPPAVDPATVFGGAAAQIPPSAPTGTAVVPLGIAPSTVPQPPAVPAATPASAPSTVAATPPNGVDLDADGLPWDERIHAGSKTKTTKGVWTAKRGVNDGAFIAKVKAELRALMAIPAGAPVAPPAAPPVAAAPAQMPLAPVAPPPPPIVTAAGAAVGLPTAPPVPQAAQVTLGAYAGPATFPDLITAFTPAMSQGRLTTELLNEACAAAGVPSLPLLASRPDLIPQVYTYITQTKGLQL